MSVLPFVLNQWRILPSAQPIVQRRLHGFWNLPQQMQDLEYRQETDAAASHLKGEGLSVEPAEVRRLAFALHLARTMRLADEEAKR